MNMKQHMQWMANARGRRCVSLGVGTIVAVVAVAYVAWGENPATEPVQNPDSITVYKNADHTIRHTVEERTKGAVPNRGRVRIEYVEYRSRMVPVRSLQSGKDKMERDERPRGRRDKTRKT